MRIVIQSSALKTGLQTKLMFQVAQVLFVVLTKFVFPIRVIDVHVALSKLRSILLFPILVSCVL